MVSDKQLKIDVEVPKCPDFKGLLNNPIVKNVELPNDFDVKNESTHLENLWAEVRDLWNYEFINFVHAGGSGMVFKVKKRNKVNFEALKIARKKLFKSNYKENEIENLSPVSRQELLALENLSHTNIVHLFDAISHKHGIIAISTTYIDDPLPINIYINDILERTPKKGQPYAIERLESATEFIIEKLISITDALTHMHKNDFYHFDIKPANILISGGTRDAIITDLGACISKKHLEGKNNVRVHFTWTYAHPELINLTNDPGSIEGQGLKASAKLADTIDIQKYDLYALGRTIQELLYVLFYIFGERCFSSYGFRYLHFISSLLLDGDISPSKSSYNERHGQRFINDCALNYPPEIFKVFKIENVHDLYEKLKRYDRSYSWNKDTPELDIWYHNKINTGFGELAPLTRRVSHILKHPCIRRLKSESQLGLIQEIYPGSTHTRWSHSLGVYAASIKFINALLSDPDIPTYRLLVNHKDISHILLAALIHDIGQTALGHDFESALPDIFRHEDFVKRLLNEKYWGITFANHIKIEWPEIIIERVVQILNFNELFNSETLNPIDGVASDILSSPLDADKFDYIVRDSNLCGVAYGNGIDTHRFFQALSSDVRLIGTKSRVNLSYKSKGSPAIESLLLSRYQMYGAIYWHHTFRCIQSMLIHSIIATFYSSTGGKSKKLRDISGYNKEKIRDLFYHRVICKKSWDYIKNHEKIVKEYPSDIKDEIPSQITDNIGLEFIWRFADDSIRELILKISNRDLYKRIFELKVAEFKNGDFNSLKERLKANEKINYATKIQDYFISYIDKSMRDKGPTDSQTEDMARRRLEHIKGYTIPMVIIDFPSRGLINSSYLPNILSDSARKYISGFGDEVTSPKRIFEFLLNLQKDIAQLRIFVHPDLHELIIRYLRPIDIRECIGAIIPEARLA